MHGPILCEFSLTTRLFPMNSLVLTISDFFYMYVCSLYVQSDVWPLEALELDEILLKTSLKITQLIFKNKTRGFIAKQALKGKDTFHK